MVPVHHHHAHQPHGARLEALVYPPPPARDYAPLVAVRVGECVVVGGMPPQHPSLLVRPPTRTPPPKAVAVAEKAAVAGPPWDYATSSIFVPRIKTTDSRSMHDMPQALLVGQKNTDGPPKPKVPKLKWRAFECDWKRCLDKQDRFTNLIKKGLGGKDDHAEVQAVKEALRRHYDWLMYVYLVHSSNDVTATEACYMGWLSYCALLESGGVVDPKSKNARQADLDTIFKAANFEVKGSDPNDDNPLEALNRQEWLEVIVRVARAKFGDQHPKDAPLAPMVDQLVGLLQVRLREVAELNEDDAQATDLRDVWRRTEFYQENTDTVYRAHKEKLRALYDSRIDYKDVGTHNLWDLSTWTDLMEHAVFFEDDSFSREESNLCFYFSKFEVADYQAQNTKFECMDWLSFLEALGHVVRYKEMPRLCDLKAAGFGDAVELAKALDALGTLSGGVGWNRWMGDHEPTGDADAFEVQLDETLKLLFYMLDRRNKQRANAAKADDGAKKKS
jgi:hypothetical protein